MQTSKPGDTTLDQLTRLAYTLRLQMLQEWDLETLNALATELFRIEERIEQERSSAPKLRAS